MGALLDGPRATTTPPSLSSTWPQCPPFSIPTLFRPTPPLRRLYTIDLSESELSPLHAGRKRVRRSDGESSCCEKVGLKKGRWTAEEDEKLLNYIKANGEGSWRSLPKNAGLLRCGKSCRLRWINYLREDVKRGNISADEEETIIKLHSTLGNRWSLIAGHLPGRTDNEIKNYWNSHLSRRIHTFRRFPAAAAAAAPADVFSSNKRKGGRTSRSNMKKKPEIILVKKSKTATSASNSSGSNPSASTTTAATDTSTGTAVLEGGGDRQLGLDEEHLSELLCWEGGDVDHEEGMHATSSASEEGNSAVALMGSATADSGAVGLDGADAVGEESVYGGWWGLDDLDLEVDMGVEPMPMQAWDEGRVDDGELEFLSLESLGTWLLSDDM